jgi:PAP2 superfamily
MTIDCETYARMPPMPPPFERGEVAPENKGPSPKPAHRRLLIAGPVVALVSLLAAVITTNAAGLPLRDPDHVAGRRLAMVLGLVALLIALDVLVRARLRSRTGRPSRAAIASVWRERWTLPRGVAVGSALISFYVTYLAYRNLKSVVPLIRPGDLFDRQLADLDRSLFGGHDPAALLHELLGTGVGAHFMSGAYMIFFAFIPGTLAIAVVFARNLQPGLFYVTAQSINWLLAAGSYFLLPSLGPVYLEPSVFADLPRTAVGQLQELLLDQRIDFLRDPAGGAAQSIGAFSSLHVSFFFTAALTAHLLGLARPLRIGAWVLLGLTTAATIYLGWHYVLDDFAGVVLGAIAILLARALTGLDLRTARRLAAPETTRT